MKRQIRLDDTTDWGCQGSDEDHSNYEQYVADAIAEAFPGCEVRVQCIQIYKPRVVVTTRNAEGRIMCDTTTCREETDIEETVLEIARQVWDDGQFWEEGKS